MCSSDLLFLDKVVSFLSHKKDSDSSQPPTDNIRIKGNTALYFCIPLIFFLPYDIKLLGSIAFGSYIISWGLTAIAIFFMGKEGYSLVKDKVLSIFKRKK